MGRLMRWAAAPVRLAGRLLAPVSVRDAHLYGGWFLITVGAVAAVGPWGLSLGGACLFAVGVFGITPTRE